MNLLLAAAFALLAESGPEQAQIDQIAGAAPDAAVQAVGAPIGDPTRAAQAAPHSTTTTPVHQLNSEPPKAAALDSEPAPVPFRRQAQVNEGAASAEPPPGPPSPFPRRATVDAVSGHDACDPANPEAAENQACVDRIESRADQFAPTPSAEDRLLAASAEPDSAAAARRSLEGDLSASPTVQGYVYTSGLAAQPPAATQKVTPETQRALDAAAQLLGVLPAGAVVTTR